MVQPSLDWPGEPLRSLVWTLQAWAVTMLVFLAVAPHAEPFPRGRIPG